MVLDSYAHRLEAGPGGEDILGSQESLDFCLTMSQSVEQEGTVGDRLVTRYPNPTSQWTRRRDEEKGYFEGLELIIRMRICLLKL